jgi:MoaA/NifB/PqqE/SkfB family radical SAM enzyme
MSGSLTINQEKALRKMRSEKPIREPDVALYRQNEEFRKKRIHYENLVRHVRAYREAQKPGGVGNATLRGELINKIDAELKAIG